MTTLCLNFDCPQPENADDGLFCQSCGQGLRLCDRYRPLKLIGQGGFGRTFLAVDSSSEPPRRCVIKQSLWRSASASSTEVSQSFRVESERLRQLGQHPQIPQLIADFELAGSQYLIQEYIPGANLDQILARQGPFDETRIRRLLSEILPVLQFVHEHQVIHRDIKPANLVASSPASRLALVDFGASKYVSQSQQAKTGTVIGSAGYAAPEQALGKATFASDLYSLGVTCIHLLTGMHPFDLYSTSEDRWVWRTYIHTPVSLKLARLLDQLLARGLRERYATAAAVLADLSWVPALSQPAKDAQKPLTLPRRRDPGSPLAGPASPEPWHLTRTINLPGGVVKALAVSPNGRAIATGATDQTVRLWDLANGELIHTFAKWGGFWGSGHQDSVVAVVFDPDGHTLYSASQDGTIKAWDLATYRPQFTLHDPSWGTATLALTADSQTLITAGGAGHIQLWDVPTRQMRATLIHHQDWVSSLALSPDGQTLISGSWDCTLRLWHLPTGRLLKTLTAPTHPIGAIACHPAIAHLYSGDSTGQVQRWQPESDQGLLFSQHQDKVTTLAISPDGRWLATGSEDSDLQIWDLLTRTRVAVLKQGWGIQSAIFTPDSQTLVSSSADETVRFWTYRERGQF